ncbi:MAG: hypothetical protein DRR19_06800 [Candidatus Parabeggiatoa sp. nov. 1]|nr:MAG: hypothetical protein DRR19_06800 [Gammaproteobacteria bacterium]
MKKRDKEDLLIEEERHKLAKRMAKWTKFGSMLKQFSTGCYTITMPALIGLLWIVLGKDILLPFAIAALIVIWLKK